MEKLTPTEISCFLQLFIHKGYVLNFSTDDFDIFTLRSVGVPLCKKYNLSKGAALQQFVLNSKNGSKVVKLLTDLLDYYERNYKYEFIYDVDKDAFGLSRYDKERALLYKECKKCIDKINNIKTPLAANAAELKNNFSSQYLSDQIDLMINMQDKNPTEAIGKAKELIESCCKTILERKNIKWDKNWNMSKLTSETLKHLNLTPESIDGSDAASSNIKAVLGNLRGISSNIAEMRNPYGSGHGKSASYIGLESRHAKLAVGCSITFVSFVWDTFQGELSNEI